MSLTKKEIEKIEEEERVRAEAKNKYSQKPKIISNHSDKKDITPMHFFIILLLLIFIFMLLAGAGVFSIVLPIIIFFYFLPTLLACEKRKINAGAILILNLFLGWTLIGWVIAMVWAATNDQ